MVKVKICGITDAETALVAAENGADALGFVFAYSKRRITPETAKGIIDQLPPHIEKIGVFVDETIEKMEEIASFCGLTKIQLHGDEGPEVCEQLKLPLVKAVGIATEEDVRQALLYPTEYILVDSPKGHVYHGGNGQTFDWQLVENIRHTGKKMILAGGLNSENVQEAVRVVKPYMVDVSSGVETDGMKDHDKIRSFIQAAKGEDVQ